MAKTRHAFTRLDNICDRMKRAIEAGEVVAAIEEWDAAQAVTTSSRLSSYENAITYAYEEFDAYMDRCEYMEEHRDEWSYALYRMENDEREKLAHATCAQQSLIRHIYGIDEETVHEDLMLWRRWMRLFREVGMMNAKRFA